MTLPRSRYVFALTCFGALVSVIFLGGPCLAQRVQNRTFVQTVPVHPAPNPHLNPTHPGMMPQPMPDRAAWDAAMAAAWAARARDDQMRIDFARRAAADAAARDYRNWLQHQMPQPGMVNPFQQPQPQLGPPPLSPYLPQQPQPQVIVQELPYSVPVQPVVQPQPVVVQDQPQYVQGQPQYVQDQPQFVQDQPQYMQGQPQYVPGQPPLLQQAPAPVQALPAPLQQDPALVPVQQDPMLVQVQPAVAQEQPAAQSEPASPAQPADSNGTEEEGQVRSLLEFLSTSSDKEKDRGLQLTDDNASVKYDDSAVAAAPVRRQDEETARPFLDNDGQALFTTPAEPAASSDDTPSSAAGQTSEDSNSSTTTSSSSPPAREKSEGERILEQQEKDRAEARQKKASESHQGTSNTSTSSSSSQPLINLGDRPTNDGNHHGEVLGRTAPKAKSRPSDHFSSDFLAPHKETEAERKQRLDTMWQQQQQLLADERRLYDAQVKAAESVAGWLRREAQLKADADRLRQLHEFNFDSQAAADAAAAQRRQQIAEIEQEATEAEQNAAKWDQIRERVEEEKLRDRSHAHEIEAAWDSEKAKWIKEVRVAEPLLSPGGHRTLSGVRSQLKQIVDQLNEWETLQYNATTEPEKMEAAVKIQALGDQRREVLQNAFPPRGDQPRKSDGGAESSGDGASVLNWLAQGQPTEPRSEDRGNMTPTDRHERPEAAIQNDDLTVDAVLIVAGVAKAGADALVNRAARKAEQEAMVFAEKRLNPATGQLEDYYPQSPFKDKFKHPKAALEELNERMKAALRSTSTRESAAENTKVQQSHDKYIQTGMWDLDGLDDTSFPDEGLRNARKTYLEATQGGIWNFDSATGRWSRTYTDR